MEEYNLRDLLEFFLGHFDTYNTMYWKAFDELINQLDRSDVAVIASFMFIVLFITIIIYSLRCWRLNKQIKKLSQKNNILIENNKDLSNQLEILKKSQDKPVPSSDSISTGKSDSLSEDLTFTSKNTNV